MKILLLLIALAAPQAGAQEDRRSALAAALASGHYPALSMMVTAAGGPGGAQAAAFAEASPADAAARDAEWRDLELLLRGGKFDKRGENIRREVAKLPGAQWRFVVLLERERRALYKRLGWGPGGNLVESVCPASAGLEPRRCYERRETLTRAMAPLQARDPFRAWRTEDLVANMITVRDSRGLRDELYGGVHEAPCFVYNDGAVKVELVADAWANSLTPAYTWWYNFDRATHDVMYRAGGADWCGQATQEKAVRAQMDARRAVSKPSAAPRSGTLDGIGRTGPF